MHAGGQFLRGVVQRCQHLGPRMHTLVTMGAQHQGEWKGVLHFGALCGNLLWVEGF